MNDSKMNKSVIRRGSVQSGTSSNVSTLVKSEEKTYVRAYAMTKKQRDDWISKVQKLKPDEVLHPSLREFRVNEAASDPDRRDKARLLIICIGLALALAFVIFAVNVSNTYLVIGEVRLEGSSLYAESEILDAGGLSMGGGLPLLTTSAAEGAILENLPYVQSCEIRFELPNVMIVNIIDEAPALYAEINGEYYILTTSMRVLERVNGKAETAGLLYVEIPRVSRAMVGEEIVLDGVETDYIKEFFSLINASKLKGRLGIAYLEEKFDIVASVDGKYRVHFGSPSDMALKIETVSKMIEENGEKCLSSGIIDVRTVNLCGIVNEAGIDPNSRE